MYPWEQTPAIARQLTREVGVRVSVCECECVMVKSPGFLRRFLLSHTSGGSLLSAVIVPHLQCLHLHCWHNIAAGSIYLHNHLSLLPQESLKGLGCWKMTIKPACRYL